MTSRNHITLLGLLCAASLPACVDDAVVGTSGQIDVELQQATVGEFAHDSSAAIADVNGDGAADLIIWSNALQPYDIPDVVPGLPVGIYVYFGGEGRFDTEVGRDDADVVLTLQPGEFAARVVGQDLDGDGKAELVVHASNETSEYFRSEPIEMIRGIGGGLFVVRGADLTAGVHSLDAIGEKTRAYDYGREYVVHAPYAYRDLDGAPGAEFLTEPYRLADVGVPFINVRDVATGETRARLVAAEDEYLDVRGVLDHDGDGAMDVAVAYVRTNDLNPNYHYAWEQSGIGVFYGPLVGDLTLDGAEARRIPVPVSLVGGEQSMMVGGAARTLVGNVCGDELEDITMTLTTGGVQEMTVCVIGGPRIPESPINWLQLGRTTFEISNLSWALIARPLDQEHSRLFAMGSDAFAFFQPALNYLGSGGGEQVVVNHVELTYDTTPGTPRFTTLGGAMGDLDGDGLLDVALGTEASELHAGSFVHVIYGFGG